MNVLGNIDPIDAIREEIWSHRHDFSVNEVDEITLLSTEEAQQLPQGILRVGMWWWLRSPGNYPGYTAYVYFDGYIVNGGLSVYSDNSGVRPAFRINALKLPFGDKVHINNTICTVISEGLVLSDKVVCEHRFDKKSNTWETSELKRFIESEEFKNLL